jgi:hypothetical protein
MHEMCIEYGGRSGLFRMLIVGMSVGTTVFVGG